MRVVDSSRVGSRPDCARILMTLPTRDQLVKRRGIVIADAQMKFDIADWHGVADAMMDLREIDAQVDVLDKLRQSARENRGFEVAFMEAFGVNSLA